MLKYRLFTILLLLTIVPFSGSELWAQTIFQQIGISSSPNPVGSGARALGMGGAFIAVADDATAASWNPAGLAQLTKPETSVVFDYFSGNLSTEWDYTRTFPEGYSFRKFKSLR